MTRLTEDQWQAIRDNDSFLLGDLGDALSCASAAVMDGMYQSGLRIVREDRDDPPQEEIIQSIKSYMRELEAPETDGWRRDTVSKAAVIGRLGQMLQ